MVPEIEVIATRIFRSGGASAASARGLAVKSPATKKIRIRICFIGYPQKIPSYATDSRQGCSESTRCPSMRRPKPAVLIQDERDAGKGGQNVAFVIIAVVSGT